MGGEAFSKGDDWEKVGRRISAAHFYSPWQNKASVPQSSLHPSWKCSKDSDCIQDRSWPTTGTSSKSFTPSQTLPITPTEICVTAGFCHLFTSTCSYASMYVCMYSDALPHSREHTNKQRYVHRKHLLMCIICYFLCNRYIHTHTYASQNPYVKLHINNLHIKILRPETIFLCICRPLKTAPQLFRGTPPIS